MTQRIVVTHKHGCGCISAIGTLLALFFAAACLATMCPLTQ